MGLENVRDPTLASICRKYAHQQMLNGTNGTHHPDNDNGTPKDKEDTISFTVSVDSVNGAKKKYASHLLVVQLIFSTGALTLLIMQRLQQFLLYNSVNIFKQNVWFVGARRNIRILRVNLWISLNPPIKRYHMRSVSFGF